MAKKPLVELNPLWVWWKQGESLREGPDDLDFGERIGVSFHCPTCDPPHVGTAYWKHPFEAVDTWIKKGNTFEDLTLYPSIDATTVEGLGCKFHGWIKDGQVTWE